MQRLQEERPEAASIDRVPRLSIGTCLAALVVACLVPAVIALTAMVVVDYRVHSFFSIQPIEFLIMEKK